MEVNQKFVAYELKSGRQALFCPQTRVSETQVDVNALDSNGNQRIFNKKVWRFRSMEVREVS